MTLGMKSKIKGVLDGERVTNWLRQNIDPAAPVIMPVVWTATNLSDQKPEFFYRVPTHLTPDEQETATDAIRSTVGKDTAVREATPELLIESLNASIALPMAFDPIVMPGPNGGSAQYVDGGVTANTPIGVARAFASTVDVVLMDPKSEPETYEDALDIAFGVFGTMQHRILASDARAAYFETFGRRALEGIPRRVVEQIMDNDNAKYEEFMDFVQSMYATDFFIKRPDKVLPVTVVGFNDFENVVAAYKVGFEAGSTSFEAYHYEPQG
jgi:predicted acylesterase/phospholipase RssA